MKRIQRKAIPLSLRGWNLDAVDKAEDCINKLVLKAAAEALSLAFDDEMTYAYFPAEWEEAVDGLGGKKPKDPLTVYVRIALAAEEECESPTWSFSLRDLVEQMAKDELGIRSGKGLKSIADGLRECADILDPRG